MRARSWTVLGGAGVVAMLLLAFSVRPDSRGSTSPDDAAQRRQEVSASSATQTPPGRTPGTPPAEGGEMSPHPYVGMWVTADGHIRQMLLANGRYDEARGKRDSAYTGAYRVAGTRIEYVDDTGFSADGTFDGDVLHHGGYVFYREGSDAHQQAAPRRAGQTGCRRPARSVSCCAGLGSRTGEKGGDHTGPSPADRGKPGSKIHVLSDRSGRPLVVGVSSGITHDSQGLKPMATRLQMRRDPRHGHPVKPGKLHADKAYDRDDLRRWLRGKRIAVGIARRGIKSGQRLGRHRWVIERTMSWLTGHRRLTIRYERYSGNHLAFLCLAAALCRHKRFARRTT
ncbi:IS5 family transposase [Sphaerisporangium sp. TRM90804]|uniref:IS5 family transposase n=1 Tax=Sphaerisporangium sp. TRM90804 TaxID=3031113 RepID=UPI002448AD28|nr:IS5 family transposase [Sphaerisporangium sp. TRM90804]MDH2428441.1 IS5 family transposase [Sphaerisporangium sp. TRM90804]